MPIINSVYVHECVRKSVCVHTCVCVFVCAGHPGSHTLGKHSVTELHP